MAPEEGHTKYLTAAQLFPGTQARDLYLKVTPGAALVCHSVYLASNNTKNCC